MKKLLTIAILIISAICNGQGTSIDGVKIGNKTTDSTAIEMKQGSYRASLKLDNNGYIEARDIRGISRLQKKPAYTFTVAPTGGDFASLYDAMVYINALSGTEGIQIDVTPATYPVTNTITFNSTHNVFVRGGGSTTTLLVASTGLTNKPMLDIKSGVQFDNIQFVGYTLGSYGTLSTENCCNITNSAINVEFDGFAIMGFYDGINMTSPANLYVFQSTFAYINNAGVRINATGTTNLVASVGLFQSVKKGFLLEKSTVGVFDIFTQTFYNASGDTCICYRPATYTTGDHPSIIGNKWNIVGGWTAGFDFSRSDGRDKNIVMITNVGTENKTPHCKINSGESTATTTITTAGTYYKDAYTNASNYTCKFTIADNKATFQPNSKYDLWANISLSASVNANGRVLHYEIVKNGNTALYYGRTRVRCQTSGEYYPLSLNVYLPDVSTGDYFEIYVTSSTNGDVVTTTDVNWSMFSQ